MKLTIEKRVEAEYEVKDDFFPWFVHEILENEKGSRYWKFYSKSKFTRITHNDNWETSILHWDDSKADFIHDMVSINMLDGVRGFSTIPEYIFEKALIKLIELVGRS